MLAHEVQDSRRWFRFTLGASISTCAPQNISGKLDVEVPHNNEAVILFSLITYSIKFSEGVLLRRLHATAVRDIDCNYEKVANWSFKSHPADPFAPVVALGHNFALSSGGQYDAHACSSVMVVYEISMFVFGGRTDYEFIRTACKFALVPPQFCHGKHVIT